MFKWVVCFQSSLDSGLPVKLWIQQFVKLLPIESCWGCWKVICQKDEKMSANWIYEILIGGRWLTQKFSVRFFILLEGGCKRLTLTVNLVSLLCKQTVHQWMAQETGFGFFGISPLYNEDFWDVMTNSEACKGLKIECNSRNSPRDMVNIRVFWGKYRVCIRNFCLTGVLGTPAFAFKRNQIISTTPVCLSGPCPNYVVTRALHYWESGARR